MNRPARGDQKPVGGSAPAEAIPLSGALAIAISYLAFAFTAAFTPVALVLLTGAVAAVLLRGRIPVPRLLMLPFALVLGLVIFTNLPAIPRASTFVIASGYGVGMSLAIFTLFYMIRPNTEGEQLTGLFFGMMLMTIAGSTTQVYPFVLLLGVQGLLLGICLRQYVPPHGKPGHSRRPPSTVEARPLLDRGLLWSSLSYVVVVGLALVVAVGLRTSEHAFNAILMLADPSSYSYPQRSSLREILQMRNHQRVLARITSPAPAQYLVGRCYVRYERAGWNALPPGDAAPKLDDPALASLFPYGSVYSANGPVASDFQPSVVDRIDAAVEFRGSLFTPRDGVVLGARVPSVGRDAAGVLYLPEGVGYSGEYIVARGTPPPEPAPSGEQEQTYLQLPDEVVDAVVPLARQVCGPHSDELQKAVAVEHFLQTGYTYGRGYHLPPDRPLHGFLLDHIPAHCELFATSMTLMLRSQAIPARYITGFIVQERNEAGNYYVVREEQAHAWVEAYIKGRGWVSFDPTPPDGRPSGQERGRFSQWLDLLMHRMQQWKDWFKQMSWRQLISSLLNGGQALGRWLIEQPWRVGILVLLFLGEGLFRRPDAAGRRWWRQWRDRKKLSRTVMDPALERLLGLMARFDAIMQKAQHPRPEALTLREYARQLQSSGSLEAGQRRLALEFLDRYEGARYGSPRPSEEQLGLLEDVCGELGGVCAQSPS